MDPCRVLGAEYRRQDVHFQSLGATQHGTAQWIGKAVLPLAAAGELCCEVVTVHVILSQCRSQCLPPSHRTPPYVV